MTIDYSTWSQKFPWVLTVHDHMGRCLYSKPENPEITSRTSKKGSKITNEIKTLQSPKRT